MNLSTSDAISASSLNVTINGRLILSDLSFSIPTGEVFALLGGNGAGKSTTLKTFLGINPISGGDASVLGLSVASDIQKIRQKVAYLPESVMLYGHLSGLENIEYFLSLAGLARSADEVHQATAQVALQTDALAKPLSQYSKGMRQKTAIALALLRNAPVLLLDEPTSGLDPRAIDEFNELIKTIANNGTTVFMVTHDVYGACRVAHRIGLLDQGSLVGTFERNGNETIDTSIVHDAFAARKTS